MIEPVFHKNPVLCGHGSMMYDVTQLNKFHFISEFVGQPEVESNTTFNKNWLRSFEA
jgi:hypothetical protein